jgi:hypothetical protein
MNKINNLQIKSLFKQVEYLMSEIEWKEEFISEMDIEFKKRVSDILETNKELRSLYDKAQQDSIDSIKKEAFIIDEDEDKIIKKDQKLKSLFREVAKKTHPDKIEDDDLNDLYVKASSYYETDDIFSMYKLCEELGIDFELTENERKGLEEQVNKLKGRIKFMENSYTWTWGNSDDEEYKEKLIIDFIKQMV